MYPNNTYIKFLTLLIFSSIYFGSFTEAATNAKILQQSSPRYPDVERANNHEGRAVVSVSIRADGSAGSAVITQSSGWPLLDAEAIDTVRMWKYAPALNDSGEPIESTKYFAINFSLKDAPPMNEESLEQLLLKWGDSIEQNQSLQTMLARCGSEGFRQSEAKSLSVEYGNIFMAATSRLATELQAQLKHQKVEDPIADLLRRRKALESSAKNEKNEIFDSWTTDEKKMKCDSYIDRLNQR